MIILMIHNLMFVRVDDIHQIVLLKIEHILYHNQNHKYLNQARIKISFIYILEKNLFTCSEGTYSGS